MYISFRFACPRLNTDAPSGACTRPETAFQQSFVSSGAAGALNLTYPEAAGSANWQVRPLGHREFFEYRRFWKTATVTQWNTSQYGNAFWTRNGEAYTFAG